MRVEKISDAELMELRIISHGVVLLLGIDTPGAYRLKESDTSLNFSTSDGTIRLIEEWRKHYNTNRPNSALGYRPPAPASILPIDQSPVMN